LIYRREELPIANKSIEHSSSSSIPHQNPYPLDGHEDVRNSQVKVRKPRKDLPHGHPEDVNLPHGHQEDVDLPNEKKKRRIGDLTICESNPEQKELIQYVNLQSAIEILDRHGDKISEAIVVKELNFDLYGINFLISLANHYNLDMPIPAKRTLRKNVLKEFATLFMLKKLET
jgi:hypothetical protein